MIYQVGQLEEIVDLLESAALEVEVFEILEFLDALQMEDVFVVGQIEGHQLLDLHHVENRPRNLLQVHVRQVH